MPRKLPEEFEGKNLIPLCIASNLSEAKRIESILDKKNIDYTFEITPITEQSVFSVLFGGIKDGVMFLVPSEQTSLCKDILAKEGFASLPIE
ncbi:MAG: hypothetical protein HY755_04405 [Nitrospirae bacterium]|nr:hypothetical protein [Nitrospirota bacterium]